MSRCEHIHGQTRCDACGLGSPRFSAGAVHVSPEWGREHETDGAPCWCGPDVIVESDSAPVLVHKEPGS